MKTHPHSPRWQDAFLSRRDFLARSGMGMAGLGLAGGPQSAGLLSTPAEAGSASLSPLAAKAPHFKPRAKRVIHLFMQGGPSHVDTFDPKPLLTTHEGKPIKEMDPKYPLTGAAFGTPFKFQKYGKSGLEVSEVFAKVAEHADNLCVLRGMHTATPAHEHAMMLLNCGEERLVRPSLGSWVTYGLGTENQNLPGFIAMSPTGLPLQGEQNWQSAFLPGLYQGNYVETRHTQIERLIEHIRSNSTSLTEQRRQLDLLHQLEEEQQKKRAGEAAFDARLQTFETAYRMQMEATDAFDISREPENIRAKYGNGPQGRQLLIARRLLERGVRFIQAWQDGWDNHSLVEQGVRALAKDLDQPLAAFLSDLQDRGMLDDTLVIWGGEFGRTPSVDMNQNVDQSKGKGRDHNHMGFSMWMAGGGVKGGHVHGATDQWGYAATEGRMDVHDLHATILHILGFDHTRLTYRHAGRDFRLTDVKGNVAESILA